MTGHHTVTIGTAGEGLDDVLGGGISLILPYKASADNGVESGGFCSINGQVQRYNTVATSDGLVSVGVRSALGVSLAIPCVTAAYRLRERGLVGRVHDGSNGDGRTFTARSIVSCNSFEIGCAAEVGGVAIAACKVLVVGVIPIDS